MSIGLQIIQRVLLKESSSGTENVPVLTKLNRLRTCFCTEHFRCYRLAFVAMGDFGAFVLEGRNWCEKSYTTLGVLLYHFGESTVPLRVFCCTTLGFAVTDLVERNVR